MLSIEKGSEKERDRFKALCLDAIPRKNELVHKILMVRTHLQELEKKAAAQRQELNKMFNKIRQKIVEREQTLKV